MRLIKHRNGYSETGRLAANWAQTSALAHTSKVLPGVLVRRTGDFTNIWKTEVDHFFITAGLVGDQLKLASSATARGTFAAFDGTEPVSYYGKGLGLQESRVQDGTLPAFNGASVPAAVDSFYRTRNGRTAEFSYGVKHVLAPYDWLPGGGVQYAQIVTPSVGEVYLDPVSGTHRFVANVTTMTLVDGQYTPLYILDHDGDVTAGNVPFVENREAGHVDVRLLGRGARLMKHRYFRSVAADGTPVPGTFFSFSTNAGAQFTPMPSAGPMFDDLVAVQAWCDTFPTAAPRVRTHNFATANVAITTCRISGATAAVVARVPYLQLDVADPEAQDFLRGRVRLGRLDCATGVMASEAVLYDGRVAIASLYVVTMIPVAGGALLLTRDPDDLLVGANVAPWRIRFTADGVSLVDIGNMPKPGYQTGLPTAVNPTRLICPMWDGRHSLYQSDDRGATWVRRATLYEGGDEPTNTHGELFMEQFNSVAFLRKDGRAASAAPGAPWIHDSRLPAPA